MDLKSGFPYWQVANGLIAVYPPLVADDSCDVAVIGGGITGALVADRLVEAGVSTVLLDKREFGWGSTCASTALLQYELDVSLRELIGIVGEEHGARSYRACLDAIGEIERLVSGLDDDCGFARTTSLYLASRRRDAEELEAECRVRARHGIEVELWDQRRLASDYSIRRRAALYSRDAAQVDPYRLTHALLRRASARGLRAYDRVAVTSSNSLGEGNGQSRIELVTDRGFRVASRAVVFATGYESESLLRQPEVKLRSTYAVVSEPLTPAELQPARSLVWESARPYLYVRTTEDGRVMAGGEDTAFDSAKRRDRMVERKARVVARKVKALLPDMPFEPAFAWAGTFADTADGLPYIGEHPDYPHTYFALCYGGNGTIFAAIAAELIRDAYLGRQNPNSALFRFGR